MHRSCFAVLAFSLAAGCATSPSAITAVPAPVASFAGEGLITQRAVLTARGRQFPLNGYLAQNATGSRRLIVTETFGNILADVLLKPDGSVHVMRSSKLLRPSWIVKYVAADMECVFGGATNISCRVQVLNADHFIVKRRWYTLDLRTVEKKSGPQPADLFDETRKEVP